MKELIIPSKDCHEYVIGIDFGHGETSAALCKLDWAAEDAPAFGCVDLDLASNSKVIVSAICKTADGNYYIGEKAFAPVAIKKQSALRVCFKAEPQDIDGENEQLMIEYMRAVYATILANKADLLTPDNHVVYIARPSGWHSETTKRLYEQMALAAGIPLAGLTSESRAAFFYAKNEPNIGFQKIVDDGAIVVDLGSSTLDFTYLREGEEALDHGYPSGASIVEKAIYEDQIVANEDVLAFTQKYPKLQAALLYEARKVKEKAYKEAELPIRKKINIEDIYDEDEDFIDAFCRVKYAPINPCSQEEEGRSINDVVEEREHYLTTLYQNMVEFRDKYIAGKPVHGVFMTGGASRMGFIKEQIMRAYGLSAEQVKRDDDPSLTISRGIALLGKADAVSNQLFKIINAKKSQLFNTIQNTNFSKDLAEQITTNIWGYVAEAFNYFRDASRDLSYNNLLNIINGNINKYKENELNDCINRYIEEAVRGQVEEVREHVKVIINYYSPGKHLELPEFEYNTSNMGYIGYGLNEKIEQSISSIDDIIAKSMNNVIGQAIWAAVGIFLFGIFSVAYYVAKWLISANESEAEKEAKMKNKSLDSETRHKVYNEVAEKQDEIIAQIQSDIYTEILRCDFNTTIANVSKQYITQHVDKIIKSVKIDIE